MGASGMDAWITSAMEDKDVAKALVLAGSLRRVCTAKKLAVLTNFGVAKSFRENLKKAFDLVFIIEHESSNGLNLEEYAKVEAFTLMVFNKGVYLSPNTVVLRNCDELFEKYVSFATWEKRTGEMDSSVFLFTPSLDYSQALRKIAKSVMHSSVDKDDREIARKTKMDNFGKCFSVWLQNHVPDWERLDEEYNSILNLCEGNAKSLNSKVSIANFCSGFHPLDLDAVGEPGKSQKFGVIEDFVIELCTRIYTEDVAANKQNIRADLSLQLKAYKTEPIAIVGMSFRLPGGNNVEQFWDLLIKGKEAIQPLPETRWTKEHTQVPCENRKVEGGFLSTPIDEFDAKFFGISGKEAELLDPQQRLLHEVTWEALEDAMIDPLSLRDTQTGIFVGSWLQDYRDMVLGTTDLEFFRGYMATSIAASAARLSHFLETTGPSIGTESGCSSAIVAVDMACKSLRNRDCNLAITGGVNLLLKPFDQNTLSFVVSSEGRCKTFDEGANGFGRAEGCAVLLMKRLSDALKDDDYIWGLVRGSAVTQEGVSKSFGTPTVHCESLAMKLALKDANVAPVDVSYVEAHGTGTPVGDPMEIAAIAQAYSKGRKAPLVIGSVKTNVGHTESVSGITGIIKVLLSMKNEMIPQHLNLKRLNPAINLEAIPALIPLEPMSWPKQQGTPRIAGVSSFGISGSDGHVIIQEPPLSSFKEIYESDGRDRPLHIMTISAKSPESLQKILSAYENIFKEEGRAEEFADIAYSANIGRTTFNHRAVIIAKDSKEARNALNYRTLKQKEARSSRDPICFLFTGQGSQYPKMGATLYDTSAIFRDEFNKCDQILRTRYGINLNEVLWGNSNDGNELSRTLYSQTSIFCIEYCLLKLWESWGVKPDFVMGHSLGEFCAVVAAGVLDFEDALMLVAERSRLIDGLPQGKMLVIRANKETVDEHIATYKENNPKFWVDYAALNSPDQTVVAGDSQMIEEFTKYCNGQSLKTIVLAATHAFHSRHMDPMLHAYRNIAQTVKPLNPAKDAPKYISGMEGKLIELDAINANYWVRHTREPVKYIDACKTIQSEGCSLFLEIGPHPVLSALSMMNLDGESTTFLPSIRRKEDEWTTMLDSLSNLYLSDWKGKIDWKGFDRHYKRSRVSIPFYQFNRKPIWKNLEGSLPNIHPLLGKPFPMKCDYFIFEKKLTLKNTPFVQDHVIGDTVIFPGAGFLEMCLAGGHSATQVTSTSVGKRKPQRAVLLRSLRITSPLALYDALICGLQTSTKMSMDEGDEISYSVGVHRHVPSTSDGVGEWVTHATAKYFPVPGSIEKEMRQVGNINILEIQNSWTKSSSKEFYERLPEVGLRFGPKFQSLGMGWKSDQGILIPIKQFPEDDGYIIHPIIADSMIQATMLWTSRDKTNKMKLQIPVQIGEFVWFQESTSKGRYVFCSTNDVGRTDCILLDDQGNRLARMTDVDFIETSVKLVEGMIHQQETAMPKLWREIWKSSLGPLQSAYNLSAPDNIPFLQFTEQQKEILDELNSVDENERSFHSNICNLSRYFFLNALYELGWKPEKGTHFTLDELIGFLPKPKQHFKKYIRFFLRAIADTGMLQITPDVLDKYHFQGEPPTKDEITKVLGGVITPEDHSRVEYKLVTEIGNNLSKIWLGQIDPMNLLFPDDSAKRNASQFHELKANLIYPVFKLVNDKLFAESIDACYNVKSPILRVLEVGAGSGGYSKMYLEYLTAWGKPFEFYFTDISSSFFTAAKSKFENHSNHVVFKKLDMEEDTLAQGFYPKYFDMIVAAEVLHVAKDIRKTMRNLQSLLKPGGMFQIIEATQPDLSITQIFGPLDGYWQFCDYDLRPYHAAMTPDKWEEILAGVNCDQVVCSPIYNNVNSFITARLSPKDGIDSVDELTSLPKPKYSWLIFCTDFTKSVAEKLKAKLVGVNRKVCIVGRPDKCTEEVVKGLIHSQFQTALEEVKSLEGVIYLWGLSEDGSSNRDQSQVSLPLINLVQEVMGCKVLPRLYVVTQGTAIVDGFEVINPTAGTLHGMIKSYTNELTELHLTCMDLSPDDLVINQVDKIFHDLWAANTDAGGRMIAFRNNERLCTKLVSAKVNYNEPLTLPSGCDRFQLQLPASRMISDLEFVPLESHILEENEIEIQNKAMALNFRDVFTVLKPIPEFEEWNTVGLDFAGVVTKVGSKVTSRRIGERVIGMNMDNNLSLPSHIKLREECVVPLPKRLTYAEGVTLPAVFSTAFHCLINLAKMKRGDTVLIHTASGGVGLCAIQLAKFIGADIIATAGSQRKKNYLRNLGIKHVFHSRTTEFGKNILEVTNGNGVDIVLNSITGEGFKEASLSALAKNGRFIEMSKLNVWKPNEVKELRPDVFYKVVDLTTLGGTEMQGLLKQLNDFLDEGHITPIPYERFDAVNIRGALNYLQKAKHIGKIVCMMPEVKIENSNLISTTPQFNESSTYLVTGGLGGIGLEVVKWMLSSGAKHIAIASRSSPKPKIANQLDNWNTSGKHVEAFSVDIGDYDQCRLLFEQLRSPNSEFPPIRGIMHAAGVLSDGTFENQTWSKFNYTFNPKVNGTWNLHDLSKDLLLEHFVVFSSVAASLGSPGQSNHAASNSFEDALAAYRRSIGLPATSVNWGNWGEVGVATELDFPGVRPISTSQGILALETFLKTQETHLTVANFESFALASKFFPNLKNCVEDKSLFGEVKTVAIITSDEFWKNVDNVESRVSKLVVFKDFIKSALKTILKMDQNEVIDDHADFQTLGVDSLMMLEMKNGLQAILGSRMTLTANQLKDCSNTEMLGNQLLDILQGEENFSRITLPSLEELEMLVQEDSKLADHIRPSGGMSAVEVTRIETVLLTGSTGVLGPYILRELTKRPNIKKVICLIRKMGKVTPTERLFKRLHDINLDGQVDMTKVECIQGDITDNKFGLSEDEYNHLAENVDAVINSAVRADHTGKYYAAAETSKQDIRTVNVKGTARVLEFAVHSKLKHVYHGSSILSVITTDDDFDDDDFECISEDWQDVDVFEQLPYNLGYPLSKHVSEMLCKVAVERGIPCKTFRLPVIGGDAKTGRCDYRSNHVILRWLTYLKLRCMPDMAMPMIVIPVDDCARISLDVFFNSEAPHDIYNIVHPGGGVDKIMIEIAKEFGIHIKLVSMHAFVDRLQQDGDNSPLAPFMKLYRDDEEELFELLEQNVVIRGMLQSAEDNKNFFRSRKLEQLIDYYRELESTESVMRRDIRFLKESGVFDKFEIKL